MIARKGVGVENLAYRTDPILNSVLDPTYGVRMDGAGSWRGINKFMAIEDPNWYRFICVRYASLFREPHTMHWLRLSIASAVYHDTRIILHSLTSTGRRGA